MDQILNTPELRIISTSYAGLHNSLNKIYSSISSWLSADSRDSIIGVMHTNNPALGSYEERHKHS